MAAGLDRIATALESIAASLAPKRPVCVDPRIVAEWADYQPIDPELRARYQQAWERGVDPVEFDTLIDEQAGEQ